MIVKKDSTDITTYFHLRLAADGTDATALTITGIDLQYVRNRTAPSTKADATALAATDSAHGDNQAIEIDATDQPGVYRIDWPDAAFATGVDKVILTVKAATIFTESLQVDLVNYDPADGVRLGLTALPNAAAEAAGGLFTRGTGAGQVNQDANGRLDANIAAISADATAADTLESYTDGTTPIPSNVTQISGDATAADNLESYTDGTTPMPVNATQLSGDATAADNAEAFFDGTGYAGTNNVIPTVTTVSNAVTVGTNNDKTGYALSAAGVDAILDDAITEPAATFTWAGATLRTIVGWVGALSRNKVLQTSTTQTLRNDADTADLSTSTHSDDGTTHTRGEWS